MMRLLIFIIPFLLLFNACSKKQSEVSLIKESSQDLEMISVYTEAYEALNSGDAYYAAEKFLEAELLFPQSKWAPRAALMASFSYYLQNYYTKALSNLERFLLTYPNSKNLVYVHYLIAMCYYETIEDEKKDTGPIFKAKEKFNFIVENYPNTDFALDANFKLDLIEDILAAKEMYVGRHYLKKGKWIASMNRFKNILENYDKTIFVEEAIHRLVEINYKIGLVEESQKYAKLLGYNYQSSEWYKKSYKVFNKDYTIRIPGKTKEDKEKAMEIFKKIFD